MASSETKKIAKNKIKFTVTDVDSKQVDLAVVRPSRKDIQNANIESGRAFSEAVRNGFILNVKIDDILRSQDLWNDEKEKEKKQLEADLNNGKKKLAAGGIKLSEARKIAIDMMKKRQQLRELLSVRTDLEGRTAEGQAENAKLNYLVYACTVYNDSGDRYYKSLDDYYVDAGSDVGTEAALNLMSLLSGIDLDLEDKTPELKFLRKNKLVDSKDRLVDSKGRLIDLEGRLINEDGYYVNEDGELVDVYGNKVDNEGNLLVDFIPFINDLDITDNSNNNDNDELIDKLDKESVDTAKSTTPAKSRNRSG